MLLPTANDDDDDDDYDSKFWLLSNNGEGMELHVFDGGSGICSDFYRSFI